MNVQEIFDKVIQAGIYSENLFVLMCYAMKKAEREGIISTKEYNFAKIEIDNYLGAFGSLAGLLSFREQPWDFDSRLAIFKDWENRPKFK